MPAGRQGPGRGRRPARSGCEDRRAGSATGRPRSPPAAGDPRRAARRRRLCADQSRPSPGARPPATGRLRRPRGAGGRTRGDTRREPRRDARAAPRTPAAEHRRPAGGQRGARRPGLCHLYLRFDRHAQGRHGRAPLGGQPPELDAASLSDRRTRRASAKDSGDVRRIRLGSCSGGASPAPACRCCRPAPRRTRGKCCGASSATRSRSSTSCRRC